MKSKSSRALSMAHIIKKHSPEFTWRDCVTHAWYLERFRKALNEGVVEFTFFKKDGSYRSAKGTTNLVLLPEEKKPKGASPKSSPEGKDFYIINYYDFEKQDWRSFQIWQFASVCRLWRLLKVESLKSRVNSRKSIVES